jgi:hypothetical protein
MGGFMCGVYTWLHHEVALFYFLFPFSIRSSRSQTLPRNGETSKGTSREASTVSIQRYVRRGGHCGMTEEDDDGNAEYPPTPSPEGESSRQCLRLQL